jgi:hypothetical protein
MSFQLDTSGVVEGDIAKPFRFADGTWAHIATWDRLSPFAQGAVARFLEEIAANKTLMGVWYFRHDSKPPGFRHIHHESLALILRDCEAYTSRPFGTKDITDLRPDTEAGRRFWGKRQVRWYDAFSPLRVFLSDEGRVCLERQS